jgi:hypothetical protein
MAEKIKVRLCELFHFAVTIEGDRRVLPPVVYAASPVCLLTFRLLLSCPWSPRLFNHCPARRSVL